MDKEKTCFMVGHAHIDAAWLWTKDETERVCQTTFASVLELMKRYPDFKFSQSSAQYYRWMEEKHPEVFEEIRRRVKEGRWEIVGGMWVESDCNMPSGEALVRQILYGKRYFLDKFGVEVKVGWLPDTFGFCWTLPQIFKKCGIKYFVTSKLNWETTLPFPYSVFWWQAPDGSRVLACQTIGPYNHTSLRTLAGELKLLIRHQGIDKLLFIYGCGDHGGGPTIELIEEILKFQSQKKPSFKVLFSKAEDYFHSLEKEEQGKRSFPVVNEELYLKTHRGTYTTQAKVKLSNRKAECLLENAEKFACMAERYGLEYPKQKLEEAWKRLLFNQFHDILAGSSIEKVYEDAQKDYAEVFKVGEEALFSSLRQIAKNVNTKGEGRAILVFNPLSWERDGLVEIDLSSLDNPNSSHILDEKGQKLPCQVVEEEKKLIFIARDVPSLGYREYRATPMREKESFSTDLTFTHKKETLELENRFYRISIETRSGLLTSIYDKLNGMEILDDSKKGGIFQIYEDFSLRESAWNIWLGALSELNEADEVSIVEKGPVRLSARIKHTYRQKGRPQTSIIQKVRLYSDIPLIEFKVDVDWHAEHRMLKVAFPLNLHSEEATYDIPYGAIKRKDPAAPSANSVDRTKWEVAALKWMDYTDERKKYGVSLLSECKYGFDLKGNVMRMSLLRSPDYPDPLMMGLSELPPSITDQGKHTFSYALYPHKGSWKEAGTMRKGYEFNFSLLSILESAHMGTLPKSFSFLRLSPESVILEAVKKAEDSDTLILRLYETEGKKTRAELLFSEPPQKVWETDMMERKILELPVHGKTVQLDIGAHEIKTIQVQER